MGLKLAIFCFNLRSAKYVIALRLPVLVDRLHAVDHLHEAAAELGYVGQTRRERAHELVDAVAADGRLNLFFFLNFPYALRVANRQTTAGHARLRAAVGRVDALAGTVVQIGQERGALGVVRREILKKGILSGV